MAGVLSRPPPTVGSPGVPAVPPLHAPTPDPFLALRGSSSRSSPAAAHLPGHPRPRGGGVGDGLSPPAADLHDRRRHGRPCAARRCGDRRARRPDRLADDPDGRARPTDGPSSPRSRSRSRRTCGLRLPRVLRTARHAPGLLAPLGVDRLPSIGGLFGAALVLTLVSYPYVSLAARAAIQRTDPAMRSRLVCSATRMAVFRRVTLPVLVPAISSGPCSRCSTRCLTSARSRCSSSTASRAIYLQYGASFDRSLAAILALVLVVITFS